MNKKKMEMEDGKKIHMEKSPLEELKKKLE
jgi:hypothetical protein